MSKKLKSQKLIQDLIMFYVKENYNNYITEKGVKSIPEKEIDSVVHNLYTERKQHLKEFITGSMKEIMGEDYIGDLFINNMLNDVFRDDTLCKNRIILEIKEYQNGNII